MTEGESEILQNGTKKMFQPDSETKICTSIKTRQNLLGANTYKGCCMVRSGHTPILTPIIRASVKSSVMQNVVTPRLQFMDFSLAY